MTRLYVVFFMLSIITLPSYAALKVAVASNFKVTLSEIVSLYHQQTGQKVLISSGSTGVLYNQIKHGAPFDLFLSADRERAQLIEESKLGLTGSRFTYASGTLAFWQPNSIGTVTETTLKGYKGRLAIANPKLAPYGWATQQALMTMHLWKKFSYIKGNNIAQTYQFIDTGNIDAGFVAHSLLIQNEAENYYLLPTDSYPAIEQQGVVLNNSRDVEAVKQFVAFLQSEPIKQLIRSKGYQ